MKKSTPKQTYRFDDDAPAPANLFLLRRSCRIVLIEDWRFELPLVNNRAALNAIGQTALADSFYKINGYSDAGRFNQFDATGKPQTVPVVIPAGTELLINRVSARYGVPVIVLNYDIVKTAIGPKGRTKKQRARVSIEVTDVECVTMKYRLISSPDFKSHIERRNAHIDALPTVGALYTFTVNLRCNTYKLSGEMHELAASVDYEREPSTTAWRAELVVPAGSRMKLLAMWSAKFNGLERSMYAFLLQDGTTVSMMLLGSPSRFMRLVDKEMLPV